MGFGYVGKAFHAFFKDHYEVRIYDPAIAGLNDKDIINECDVGVVCVPTPSNDDNSCNTDFVEDSVAWLQTPIILIKSTIEIGTTKRLAEKYNKKIVFSPEFAGESKYWTPQGFTTDVKQTPFFIFGGKKELWDDIVKIFEHYTKRIIEEDNIIYFEENIMTLMYFNHKNLFIPKEFDIWWHEDNHKEGTKEFFEENKSFYKMLEEIYE